MYFIYHLLRYAKKCVKSGEKSLPFWQYLIEIFLAKAILHSIIITFSLSIEHSTKYRDCSRKKRTRTCVLRQQTYEGDCTERESHDSRLFLWFFHTFAFVCWINVAVVAVGFLLLFDTSNEKNKIHIILLTLNVCMSVRRVTLSAVVSKVYDRSLPHQMLTCLCMYVYKIYKWIERQRDRAKS